MESGPYNPGYSRRLKGVSFREPQFNRTPPCMLFFCAQPAHWYLYYCLETLACCLWLATGTYNNFSRTAPQSSSRFAGQISEAAQLRTAVSSSVQTSLSPGPDPTAAALSDTEKFLPLLLGDLGMGPGSLCAQTDFCAHLWH